MIFNDSIVALATAPGAGAIAVIRVSGKEAIRICSPIFEAKNKVTLNEQISHTLQLGFIKNDHRIIDEVLVSIFRGNRSYTGEPTVEISCHGSTYIQQEIINLLIQQGCRLANPGEFTMRAFINGKMDLSQAEAVADLIASNSEASHQMAIQQMRGGISNELSVLRTQLLDFASLIELELDFSGEDVEFADRSQFIALVSKITQVLKRLIDSFAFGNAMKNGIPVAIIGEPNVGKSTLLNTLLNEDRAIVSDVAGTTRDTIEDEVIIEGVAFRFIDTAGIRETKDIVENIGIKKAYEKAENAQLVVYLVESTKLKLDSEQVKLKRLKERFANKRILVIANKIDQLSVEEQKVLFNEFKTDDSVFKTIFVSAKNKTGIDELKNELTALVNVGALSNNDTIVSNSRHFEALSNALVSIYAVQEGMNAGIPSDLFAIDVRECLRHLGNITGEYDVDKDILGNIFSNFCIGK